MKSKVRLAVALFFIGQSVNAAEACLRVGLLGEFTHTTVSFSQPFGDEIKAGTALGLAWVKQSNPGACVSFELIDIDNSIANIDGHIRQAAAKGVHYFIGLGTSDQALAARKALIETNSILITPTASATAILEQPSRIVMMYPTNEFIAASIAREVQRRGIRKVLSIFASNNKYSSDMNLNFKKAFEKNGGQFEDVAIRTGRADLSEVISKLKMNDYKYVFVPLFELDAATLIAEVSRNGLQPFFIGTDAWGTYSNVIRHLVKNRSQLVILPIIYDPASKAPVNNIFVSGYKKNISNQPTDLAAFSFDAVNVAYKLNRTCGDNVSTGKIPFCLRQTLPLQTTTGTVAEARGLALRRTFQIRDVVIGLKQ